MNFINQAFIYTLIFIYGLLNFIIGFIFIFLKICGIADWFLYISHKINAMLNEEVTPGLRRMFLNVLSGDIPWDSIEELRNIDNTKERIKMQNKYFNNIVNNLDLEKHKGKQYYLSTNELMYLKLQKIKKEKGLHVRVLFKYMQPQPFEKLTIMSRQNLIKHIFSRDIFKTLDFLFNYMFMYVVEIKVV